MGVVDHRRDVERFSSEFIRIRYVARSIGVRSAFLVTGRRYIEQDEPDHSLDSSDTCSN